MRKEDLKDLDKILKQATFIEASELTHPRTDGVDRFYYFEGEIRGKKVRLNVARRCSKNEREYKHYTYFLYSVNDIKKPN